jgi:hypothetical protein
MERALPCRSLPCRALVIINEYSKPITKGIWRKSKPIITPYKLYLHLEYIFQKKMFLSNRPLHRIILNNVLDTDWYYNYSNIKLEYENIVSENILMII